MATPEYNTRHLIESTSANAARLHQFQSSPPLAEAAEDEETLRHRAAARLQIFAVLLLAIGGALLAGRALWSKRQSPSATNAPDMRAQYWDEIGQSMLALKRAEVAYRAEHGHYTNDRAILRAIPLSSRLEVVLLRTTGDESGFQAQMTSSKLPGAACALGIGAVNPLYAHAPYGGITCKPVSR